MNLPEDPGRLLIWALAGLVALVVLAATVHVGMRLMGVSAARTTPGALSELLQPYYRVTRPEGEGPFPTVLLASGCDGPKDNLETWSRALNAIGWATITVDSHGPRGYNTDPMWRLVCTGALLPGGARAGDHAVALADARAMPFVDPERLALAGASHGGWAVLDLLSLADLGRRPENLTNWPVVPGGDPLAGVVAVAAIYPYCGAVSRVKRAGWHRSISVLLVAVAEDAIVDETDCVSIAERALRSDLPVLLERFSGVTHGFDQEDKSALSTLRFDPEATEQMMELFRRFFANAANR